MPEKGQTSLIALREIAYYAAFICLKGLFEQGLIPLNQFRQANVALAKTYGVFPYHI